MIDTIYVEGGAADHARTHATLGRFPNATIIPIDRYGEVFNRNQQNFRLQKKNPALILAEKKGNLVLPAPEGYGIGSAANYYFSHVLNCLYDCRYCFLQGMYRSAHYVLFVNYEDFQTSIASTAMGADALDPAYFFSGYDGDSLVFDSFTGFVDAFVPFFASLPNAILELRTKSVAIRSLLTHEPNDHVVVAFSFTPAAASEAHEHGVPSLEARLQAMKRLAEHGYRLGLRFDPLLYVEDFRTHYRALFEEVFRSIEVDWIHSVSFGPFRMPRGYFRRMVALHPEEKLFAGLPDDEPMVSYAADIEAELRSTCEEELRRHVPDTVLFPCRTP